MSHTNYRSRHDRQESHFGELPATLVELSSALRGMEAGSTVQETLLAAHEWVSRRESYAVALGHFTGDATIAYGFTGDAWITT